MTKIRIILDVNIWVSFAIGKKMLAVRDLVLNDKAEIITCEQLVEEFKRTLQKPKLQKYISSERAALATELLEQSSTSVKITSTVTLCRDAKDNYLLALAQDAQADFLLTGDDDLIVLNPFGQTQIMAFHHYLTTNTQHNHSTSG